MSITPEQVLIARDLLGWSREELAAKARLSKKTVGHVESKRRTSDQTIAAIRFALEAGGVEFTAQGAALRDEKTGR